MGAETVLPVDIANGNSGHAAKHNAVNGQVNYLTEQLAALDTGGDAALAPTGLRNYDGMVPLTRTALLSPSGSNPVTSNGTDTKGMSVLRHDFSGRAAQTIRLVYGNSNGRGAPGANAITVKAAVDTQNGASPVAVTFDGADSVVIPVDGIAISDPIFIGGIVSSGLNDVAEAPPYNRPGSNPYDFINSRTFVTVTSGQTWPLNHQCGLTGDGAESGTSVTDKRLSGTVTSGGFGVFTYGPSMVLTSTAQALPIVVGLGDSIMGGTVDDAGHFGWFDRAMRTARASLHSLKFTEGGSKSPYINATSYPSGGAMKRAVAAMDGATHVIYAAGINEYFAQGSALSQSANDQAKRAMWRDWILLADMGLKVYACTLTPYTTSSDSWATVGNQTARATEANRVEVNTWIRTVPAPLTGVLELADAVESARNSGKWKANYSPDGLHPNATGHAAMAAAVDTSLFTG